MTRLFPFESPFSRRDPDPTVINLDEDGVEEILDALGSETARQYLLALYEEPRTMSELAEVSDTSVQNVDYHLQKFEGAGLVEPIDTVDAEQGGAVTVWAPRHDPIVVTAGSEQRINRLRDLLKRVVGTVGILALVSLLVEGVARLLRPRGLEPEGQPPPTTPTPKTGEGVPVQPPRNVTETAQNVTATATSTPSGEMAGGLFTGPIPPGFVFFVGGLFVVALVASWGWYRRIPR